LSQAPAAVLSRDIAVGSTVEVVAGERYAADAVHRFLFGSGWRPLWTTPVRVPVLDLRRTGGGLRPVERGGGFQTSSLELRSADGREFRFRSVDKDASQTVPAQIRWPGIVSLMRDQTSALHPAGALVAASLAGATGVPHLIPRLVVMPDDPQLGPFRLEFAGMLGVLEERPAPRADGRADLFGFRQVLETDSVLARMKTASSGRIDAREYVTARLLDLFLNDWDRHSGNWLWGTRDSAGPQRWSAIPKDRDQAFASYDGLALAVARLFVPKLVPFTGDYHLRGLTVNAKTLDARIAAELAPGVWDSIATAMVTRLSDAAIERALREMPAPYYRLSGQELTTKMRERRSGLPAAARAWARMLSGAD
jgi:hypothetical protein